MHRHNEHRYTHVRIHTCTLTQPCTQPATSPGTAHTFRILLALLKAKAFCSLLFPFSLSVSAPPFPFSISSFFHLTTHAVGFSSQPPPPPLLSLSFPPSLHSPPSRAQPPPPLLSSLVSVCRARGHYLSRSGHVQWNGGVCSEQKHREQWGIDAGSSSLGNSSVQQSSYQWEHLSLTLSTPFSTAAFDGITLQPTCMFYLQKSSKIIISIVADFRCFWG